MMPRAPVAAVTAILSASASMILPSRSTSSSNWSFASLSWRTQRSYSAIKARTASSSCGMTDRRPRHRRGDRRGHVLDAPPLGLKEGRDLLQRKEIQILPVAGRQAKIGMQEVAKLYDRRCQTCRGRFGDPLSQLRHLIRDFVRVVVRSEC